MFDDVIWINYQKIIVIIVNGIFLFCSHWTDRSRGIVLPVQQPLFQEIDMETKWNSSWQVII